MGGQAGGELISLPPGGGAVRGIGDAFETDLHTGTGSLTIPLELPAGRIGHGPQLALRYGSGNGNGPFGFGWEVALPRVQRRTDRALPRYDGEDVFVLSGAEDLVPVAAATGGVQRYRPTTESVFARIEHHTAGTDHWTVWDRSGLVSTYGTPRPADAPADWRDPAAVADPDEPGRVAAWLVSQTVDPLGNLMSYQYAADPAEPDGAQRYLAQIGYVDYDDGGVTRYLVQVRFVYESRPDVHVDRRNGFAVATGLRCSAIETWIDTGSDASGTTAPAQLTRSVQLGYSDATTRAGDNGCSLLTSVTVVGHDGTMTESLPPLEFGYSTWDPSRRRFRSVQGSLPARPLSDRTLDLVDLHGVGLPDLLELSDGIARQWRNTGDGAFDVPRTVSAVPAGVGLGRPGVQLLDADGDGRPDLLVSMPTLAGYFPVDAGASFDTRSMVRASVVPATGLDDPLARLVDLDGDGISDLLRLDTTPQAYLNGNGAGWRALPLDSGSPLRGLSFADPRLRIADMTGDGLSDLVFVGQGCVRYWPNLGFGRFGDPVTMSASPRFDDVAQDAPYGMEPSRVLLGDVDGDGCADIVYVGIRATTVWVNRAGQGFAPPVTIPGTPMLTGDADVRLTDLLGNGVSGVLWTYGPRLHGDAPYKFLDLTGGSKPYLLTDVDNHMGGRTRIGYTTSTQCAMDDSAAGTPWRTTLPFPVHVVESVATTEVFSGCTTTTAYRYHHGYWDGVDREFRGFGCVERYDALSVDDPADSAEAYCPPTLSRTWFHLGPVGRRDRWSELDLSDEWWAGDSALLGAGDRSAVPAGLIPEQWRRVVRALRGKPLRVEVYGLDGDAAANRPYSVTEHCYDIVPVYESGQPDTAWLSAPVVAVPESGQRTTQWDRGDDPLTQATFTTGFDRYGNARLSLHAAVPRGRDPRVASTGAAPYLATLETVDHALRDDDTRYICDRVAAQRLEEVVDDRGAALTAFRDAAFAGALPLRLIGHERTFYDGEPFVGLPAGTLGDHGLATATASLALTPGILAQARPDGAAPYLLGTAIRAVNGLSATYFRDDALTATAFERHDASIAFSWPAGPDPALCQRTWSARWTGQLQADATQTYTVSVVAKGGTRVSIDGAVVIDDWAGTGQGSAQVALQQGTAHALVVEFHATDWPAALALNWSVSGGAPQPVPSQCLTPAAATDPSWGAEYPAEFQSRLATLAGYTYQIGGDGLFEPGYYVTTGTRYDVDDAPTGRGLATVTRDAMGQDTHITYDRYALLPVAVRDQVGLVKAATYDYRTLKPTETVDANGNVTRSAYTPLGLDAWIAALGRPGEQVGDTVEQPGTVYTYGLTAYDDSGEPTWVQTVHRVDYRWTVVEQANAERAAAGQPPLTDAEVAALFPPDEANQHPDRFVVSRTYGDGAGRVLQRRRQAHGVVVADLGLPLDGSAVQDVRFGAVDSSRVVVSGTVAYDNKGNVMRSWEPCFGTGWDYQPPALAGLACARTFRDARSRVVRVVRPDGADMRTVYGVPADLAAPDSFTPTPWERYDYDANDNAGRTHASASQGWSDHWNTPTSRTVDALGRTSDSTRRTADAAWVVRNSHDIAGNVVSTTDALGRVASTAVYDLLGRIWSNTVLDKGTTFAAQDAAGRVIETRDAKGAITLTAHDAAGRSVRNWARDRRGGTTTLRSAIVFGDDPAASVSATAAASNLLGRPWRVYDEAGTVTTSAYNIAGRELHQTRQVFSLATLSSALPGGADGWDDAAYVVDWSPAAGSSLDDVAARLLDGTVYDVDTTWDALGRRTTVTAPLDAEGRRRLATSTYTPDGELSSLTVDGTVFVSRVAYDAHGRRVAVQLGNGTVERYAYDPLSLRLVRQHVQLASPLSDTELQPQGSALVDRTCTYDLVGNPLTVIDSAPGSGVSGAPADTLTRTYTYDALYRVTSGTGREHVDPVAPMWSAAPRGTDVTATRAYQETFAYDPLDNLTAVVHRAGSAGWTRTFTQVSGSNRLASVTSGTDTFTYGYDACGNLLHETDSRQFSWDATDRLTSFRVQAGSSVPSQFAQYRYDVAGQRVLVMRRDQGGTVELLVRPGAGLERLVLDAGGQPSVHDELHLSEGAGTIAVVRIGDPLPGDQRPPVGYVVRDPLGSHVAVADATGALVNREEFSPYGETTFGGYARKRYRFTGRERDDDSGLSHHGSRYYACWLGRWWSCDPAGHVDGANLYAYCQGNPVALTDPGGRQAAPPDTSQVRLPSDVKQVSEGKLGQEFRAHPLSKQGLKALAKGLLSVLAHSPQNPDGTPMTRSQRWAAFKKVTQLEQLYARGLGQNTAKALVGERVPEGSVRGEWLQDSIAAIGPLLQMVRAVKTASWLYEQGRVVTIYKLTPVKELGTRMRFDAFVTTDPSILGVPLREAGGRLDVIGPAGLTKRYTDDLGCVVVEARTTVANLRVPQASDLEVMEGWRSSMPTQKGFTGAVSPYRPIIEFQLNESVPIPEQPTRPVLYTPTAPRP